MNTRIRLRGFVALVALALTPVAHAATIRVDNYSGTPGQIIEIPIFILAEGSGDITFVDLDFGLGDSGATPIHIIAADRTTGTIWTAGVQGINDFPTLPTDSRVFSGTTSSGTPPAAVAPEGILLTYTLDLTGTTIGTSFPLNPNFSGGTLIGNTNVAPIYTEVPTIVAGTLSIIADASAADFDEDGDVDRDDFEAWQGGFGTAGGANHGAGDADADGDVDGGDFLVWQREFGQAKGSGSLTSAVPEPASVLLVLTFTGLGLARCRTRRT